MSRTPEARCVASPRQIKRYLPLTLPLFFAQPYYIPAGASLHKLGACGLLKSFLEIEEQEKALGIFFDTIVVCSVTGSSHAGLLVGSLLEKFEGKRQRKVIGIDASGKIEKTRAQVMEIAQNTCAMLGLPPVLEEELILDGRFNAGVYGLADEATLKAIKVGAETDAFVSSDSPLPPWNDVPLTLDRRLTFPPSLTADHRPRLRGQVARRYDQAR